MRLEAPNIGGKLAREVKSTDMSIPQAVINLDKGARVMSTWNGWKKAGVINGGQGAVKDIIFGEGQGSHDMPLAILVRFKTASKGEIYRDPS